MSELAKSEESQEAAFKLKKLASRIANLCDQDSWPADIYARLTANQALKFLDTLTEEDIEVLSEWVDVATASSDLSVGNTELWLDCLFEFTGFLGEEKFNPDEESSDQPTLDPHELLEKSLSVLTEIVPLRQGVVFDSVSLHKLIEDQHQQREELLAWAEDVVSTVESDGCISANGGTLLNVPECLREFFDWDKAAAELLLSDKAEPSDLRDNDPPAAETAEEARVRIEEMIPTAFKMLRDAESIAESRKKAHEAAKKNVEAMQDQLNQLVEELTEALTGIAGGDYQLRLPLDRVSNTAATASASTAAKSGITPDSETKSNGLEKPVGLVAADPIAGESVAVLVADQLSQKTNGKSDGVGIPQGTVDLLVDASLGTIGLLEEHMRKRGEYWAKDVKGVGPGKAEKIVAALGKLRECYPQPVADTEPLEELILDQEAYASGKAAKNLGGPRACPYVATGHQGRSWLRGWDEVVAGSPEPA